MTYHKKVGHFFCKSIGIGDKVWQKYNVYISFTIMVHIANVYIIFLPDFRIVNPINGWVVKITPDGNPITYKWSCPSDSKKLSFVDVGLL